MNDIWCDDCPKCSQQHEADRKKLEQAQEILNQIDGSYAFEIRKSIHIYLLDEKESTFKTARLIITRTKEGENVRITCKLFCLNCPWGKSSEFVFNRFTGEKVTDSDQNELADELKQFLAKDVAVPEYEEISVGNLTFGAMLYQGNQQIYIKDKELAAVIQYLTFPVNGVNQIIGPGHCVFRMGDDHNILEIIEDEDATWDNAIRLNKEQRNYVAVELEAIRKP